ncbi:disease resistance protein RPV1 [Rosa sericea]
MANVNTDPKSFPSSSSSSSSSSEQWRYEVFLSFRGEDTRKGFTDHLHTALRNAGINVFIDEQLRRGEVIDAELVQAIQLSMISVIVFSSNYAESTWCLDELVKIMECKSTLEQMVLPIFYDVDPSVVRKQTGGFALAFQKHEERFVSDTDKVKRWRSTLTRAANLSGLELQNTANGHEAKFIKEIIQEIIRKLNNGTCLNVARYQVGIDSRVKEISDCLCVGLLDHRIVAICGIGGMGKTTVARAIYNSIYHRFDGRSFLENVRETPLLDLQNQLLSQILKLTNIKVIDSVAEGISVIENRLRSIKVLVVVDDVDSESQLDALAIKPYSFARGSRIIITTRDEHVLRRLQVDNIYEARKMNEEEALELFRLHAFGNRCPNEEFSELARKVVDYCGGLPLALEVLGSFLSTKYTAGEWGSTLDLLKRTPNDNIQKKLEISYYGLGDGGTGEYLKNIFLDISCFFIGMHRGEVIRILDGCGISSETGIRVLEERHLVSFDEVDNLIMHDLVRDMGREIVRATSPNNPAKRSRLWDHEDVKRVLGFKSGTKKIEGLVLDLPSSEDNSYSTEAFRNMQSLRLLQLNYVKLTGSYEFLPQELNWLCWHGFPEMSIPNNFNQRSLVAIDMQYSKLKQVWENPEVLEKLKLLDLRHSRYLTKSPDFSKLPNLEDLKLDNCENLHEVDHSIGGLKNLRNLSLDALKGSPSESSNLLIPSLEDLSSLMSLSLRNCNLTDDAVPQGLGSLSCLIALDLQGNNFHRLPILSHLTNLRYLTLDNCKDLEEIPDLPRSLMRLVANHCTALERMPNFSHMSNMRELHLRHSIKLTEVPGLDKSLSCMEMIHMEGCTSLTDTFKESILKGWTTSGNGGLFLSGNDIPNWLTDVDDDEVKFQVPIVLGRSVKALTVCIVYSSSNDSKFGENLYLRVINNTQRTQFGIWLNGNVTLAANEDYLWLAHVSNDILNLEGGDAVVACATLGPEPLEVKKIGVNVEWEKIMLEYPIDWESQPYLSEDYVKEDDEENYDEDDNSDTENDHDEDNYVDDDYSDDEAGPSRSYRSLKRMRSDFKEWFQEKCARLVKDGSCAYNASPEINCCNETIELRQQPGVLAPVDAESPNRVSGFPIGFTPSPSHAHFVPTQIASSSQGGPENGCTNPQCMGLQALYQQQQMLIQQLQSENKELQRQVILSQQPNQNVVERNFLQQCIPPESQMTTQGPDEF